MIGEKTLKKVNIILTLDQAKKLFEDLAYFTDMGPRDEGWQSDELMEIISALAEAIGEIQPC